MMVRIVARALARLLFCSAVACTPTHTARSMQSCDGGHWLPASPLRTAQGYSVFMELPAVLPLHRGAFILSSLATTYDSTGKVVWPLVTPPATVVERAEQIAVGVIADSNGVSELVPFPKGL